MSKKERTEREFKVVTYLRDGEVRIATASMPMVLIGPEFFAVEFKVRATNLEEAREIVLRLRKEIEAKKEGGKCPSTD